MITHAYLLQGEELFNSSRSPRPLGGSLLLLKAPIFSKRAAPIGVAVLNQSFTLTDEKHHYLRTFGSQIEDKGSLKVEKVIL